MSVAPAGPLVRHQARPVGRDEVAMMHEQREASAGRTGWLLLVIFAAAALLRLYDLSGLPPAHYRDVALTALDALRAAAGEPQIHYTYDEGLYSNIMGLFFLVFGASDWALRLPGALFGILTSWGVYRLGRTLGLERAGLYAAALLAVSFWHVTLSRSGFRAILLPLLMVLSFSLLIEGVRREGVRRQAHFRMALGGALLGLGVHVYPTVRLVPLLLPIYLCAELGKDREAWRRAAPGIALFVGCALLIALPMIVDYVDHPEHFSYPHRMVSVFSPGVPAAEAFGFLQRNIFSTLFMFHLNGDGNWRHNMAGAPMLDPITGVFMVLGLLICLRSWAAPAGALLLSWLTVMLVPNLLSVEGVPHGLRTSAVLPPLMLICGIGLVTLERILARRGLAKVAAASVLTLFALLGVWTGYRYFVVWGNEPRVLAEHDGAYRIAARALLSAPPGVERILVANGNGWSAYGHPAEAHPYIFEMRDAPPAVVLRDNLDRLALKGSPAYIALVRRSDSLLALIGQLNPGASIRPLDFPGLSPDSPVYRVN
jgi:4-amino-4-deoxy-L-arabinose transferase-like glycosyltransferase